MKRVKLSDKSQVFINHLGNRCFSTHEEMFRDFGRRILQWWFIVGKRLGLHRDIIRYITTKIPLDYEECAIWNAMEMYQTCSFWIPRTNNIISELRNIHFANYKFSRVSIANEIDVTIFVCYRFFKVDRVYYFSYADFEFDDDKYRQYLEHAFESETSKVIIKIVR